MGLALLLLCWPLLLRAELVRDLYTAAVPVPDQAPATLAKASREALSEVLVKVTGSVEVLRNPVISAALGDARGNVQRYGFERGAAPDRDLYARIEFDGGWVTALVIEAGVPLWTANRPPVLVWLVEDGPQGHQLVSADSSPSRVEDLRTAFSRRGIPLQLPLLDLADAAALPPQVAWSLDAAAIQGASARYNVQAVLAGRLADLSSGGVAGDWLFLMGDERRGSVITAADAAAFIGDGVALVAETMAARYAVAASAVDGEGIPMSIRGVVSYADFAALINWLESLELVERARVERVRGDELQLRLVAQADPAQLATILELNKRLLPVTAGPEQGLNYQWQN
jgi:hypothetical protein